MDAKNRLHIPSMWLAEFTRGIVYISSEFVKGKTEYPFLKLSNEPYEGAIQRPLRVHGYEKRFTMKQGELRHIDGKDQKTLMVVGANDYLTLWKFDTWERYSADFGDSWEALSKDIFRGR